MLNAINIPTRVIIYILAKYHIYYYNSLKCIQWFIPNIKNVMFLKIFSFVQYA